MKKISSVIVVFLLCGVVAYAYKQQGHYASRRVEKLPAFHAIHVQGNIEVDFMQHPSVAAHISGPEKMLRSASLRVKDGVLAIGFVPGKGDKNTQRLRVLVTGSTLDEVMISGKSEFHVRGKLQAQDFSVMITQGGEFSADGLTARELHLHAAGKSEVDINHLDAQHVQAITDGSAEIELAGLALSADLQNHGTGEIDAADLREQTASATVNGKGEIKVSSYEKLSASVQGRGKIKYKGSPVSLERAGNLKHIIRDTDD